MTNAIYPDAIILACWPTEDPLLRQFEADAALMPMGDKPMLQRVLEKLVDLGCRRIAVVHGNRPQEGEALLGGGERWGCHISHHYAAQGNKPLRRLARLAPPDDRNCVLAPAHTVALAGLALTRPGVACSLQDGKLQWTGWAVLPGKAMRWLAETAQTGRDLGHRVMTGLDPSVNELVVTTTISTATVAATLDSLPRLFQRSLSAQPLGAESIGRRAHSEGVWIGNGSRVHPSARLRPPVYIGQNVLVAEHAEIGPNATIGDGCIVDSASHIEDSVLLPNTYVGRKLEVTRSLLAGNHLLNFRLGVAVRIADPEFVRDIDRGDQGSHRAPPTQRALAAMLWLALAPLGCVLRRRPVGSADPAPASIGIPRPVAGAYSASSVRFSTTHEDVLQAREGAWIRHFRATFLPGLADAISGKVALFGLQPRTAAEILSLPYYWQRLYRRAPIGLVSENLLQGREGASAEMRYAGDALCAESMPLSRVLRLLWRYGARVMAEAFTAKPMYPGTSGNKASQPAP